jgi:hypothetical protein
VKGLWWERGDSGGFLDVDVVGGGEGIQPYPFSKSKNTLGEGVNMVFE